MQTFDLSHHRRANVWLDELPQAECITASVVTRLVKPTVAVGASRRAACVEIFIPRGAQVSYGLLGAELVDADIDGLEVVVSTSKSEFQYQPSLASKVDDVRVGLLEEYADAVISGVERVAESVGAPTKAALQFRWAAHGLAGSSPSVFAKVSGIVLGLLMLPPGASDDRIRALLV